MFNFCTPNSNPMALEQYVSPLLQRVSSRSVYIRLTLSFIAERDQPHPPHILNLQPPKFHTQMTP